MAPGNPKVLFAATWQVVRHPWNLVDGGQGSGDLALDRRRRDLEAI